MNADFQDKNNPRAKRKKNPERFIAQKFFKDFSAFICVNLRPIRFLTAER